MQISACQAKAQYLLTFATFKIYIFEITNQLNEKFKRNINYLQIVSKWFKNIGTYININVELAT